MWLTLFSHALYTWCMGGYPVVRLSSSVKKLFEKLGSLLNVNECVELSRSSKDVSLLFEKCLENAVSKVEIHLPKVEISDFTKCLYICFEKLKIYEQLSKTVDSAYMSIIRNLTSMGDSTLKQDEVPDEIKRIARHVVVTRETFTIHFIRFGLSLPYLIDLAKCIAKVCNRKDIKFLLNAMKQYLQIVTDDKLIEFLIGKFDEWCIEYGLCKELS